MGKIDAGRENKPHIGIFGRCNSGKSTLLNFITGADTAITSPIEGTTTDHVRKSYEIRGFAPVIFIDTAGFDDRSPLSAKRTSRTLEALIQVDLALLVYREWGPEEERFAARLSGEAVPFIRVRNIFATDTADADRGDIAFDIQNGSPDEQSALIELIKSALPPDVLRPATMLGDMVAAGDTVILVCPIDAGAPAGRMILPQMQALRESLDRGAIAVTVQPDRLPDALKLTGAPRLVITDSQVYREVQRVVPDGVEVTTFSILLAAAKGDMNLYTEGLEAVDRLCDGDRVLVAENCSHQVSCDDIGRVKIPAWLQVYTGKSLRFTVVSGLSPMPEDLADYSLMVQCGGCMVTRSQLRNRIRRAASAGVPVTNYGMLIKKVRP